MSATTQVLNQPLVSEASEPEDAPVLPEFSPHNEVSLIDTHVSAHVRSPDFELTQSAAAGDMRAFETIYQKHNRRVYSLCLRMTGNAPEAEDLTQEVFIQLFRKIGSFRGESAFTTWLHRLTVNQVLMYFRKRSVRDEKTTEDGEMPDQVLPGSENPLQMPIVDRLSLNKAIGQLPNGYRTVFILHDVEGYEHEEIARLLKVSVGTSKSQLHKARMKLRILLRQQNSPLEQPKT